MAPLRRAPAPCPPSAGSPCRSRGSRRASKDALRRGNPLDAVVVLDRLAQRAREGLERRLDHVMRVPAGLDADMKRELGRVCDGAEELLGQLRLEVAHALDGELAVDGGERAPRDVERRRGARLVHRDDRVPVAAYPRPVAERLVERLAERYPGVLHGVVRARLEVAVDANVEVEASVTRQRVEQVVEEAHAGRALARAGAVEVERQLDVGLARRAMDLRGAAHARRSMDSACTGKPSARASAAPAGARRATASPSKDTRAMRRRNVAGDSADWNLAAPPVGSTWL